jgi:hypothetical protein
LVACVGAFSVFALALPTAANARPARCEITTTDGRYSGPCEFHPGKGGSFTLLLPDSAAPEIYTTAITLDVVSPGRGRVEAAVTTGIDDWGIARRDERYPACWAGEGFRICAY